MAAAQSNGFNANGMMFSTPDSDNDNWANGNCVGIGDGKGWWSLFGILPQQRVLYWMDNRFSPL